ncbi:MAG: AAA family ATPase [Dehalococcoidales bacterium]|nr:AAA family ATPase [Dehalococcoidales bacterium]
MSINIAVAGKGGTGKTSVSSLVIRYLVKNSTGAILAVDADPNANLGDSLGLKVKQTMGGIIALFNQEKVDIPAGMTKESYLEFKFNEALVETRGLDLLTMGRGEGADCYCYPNTMLRKFMDSLEGSYQYMVMDNEAGMEHLSRRTTQNVDELLLVSDHSIKGVRTVARLKELVTDLKLKVKRQSVIINLAPESAVNPAIAAELNKLGIQPAAVIPYDENVYNCDLQQKSILDLFDSSKAVKAVNSLMGGLLGK